MSFSFLKFLDKTFYHQKKGKGVALTTIRTTTKKAPKTESCYMEKVFPFKLAQRKFENHTEKNNNKDYYLAITVANFIAIKLNPKHARASC